MNDNSYDNSLQDKRIKSIGGDSVQKMVSNILTTCLTFEVGHKLSWTGMKNSIAVENSTFANIIVGKCIFTIGNYIYMCVFILWLI